MRCPGRRCGPFGRQHSVQRSVFFCLAVIVATAVPCLLLSPAAFAGGAERKRPLATRDGTKFLHKQYDPRSVEQIHHSVNTTSEPAPRSPVSSWRRSSRSSGDRMIHDFAVRVLGHTVWPDQCGRRVGHPQYQTRHEHDLRRYGPFAFLSDYRNPCWLEKDHTLQCLPYFYLAGFGKCGTTDLYSRLTMHPDVLSPKKEVSWLTLRRFRGRSDLIEHYTRYYASFLKDGRRKSAVLGDGSPSIAYNNKNWRLLPGNENCSEPLIINADYIRHLNPDAKIILIMRDPTARMYSDYMYFGRGPKNPQTFHLHAQTQLAQFKDCLKKESERSCAYRAITTISTSGNNRPMAINLYSIFVEDWLLRFPRDQILPLLMEDMFVDISGVMRKVFKFLDLADVNSTTMENIVNLDKQNVGRKKAHAPPMLNETRRMLDSFFLPFNQRLAAVLEDQKFLWGS